MEYFGAGLAALGVIGPGIGVGIIGGLSAQAIGRNPDAAARSAASRSSSRRSPKDSACSPIVVGLLAIFIQPA
jgi:F-type H+-transporting ATPase subunit c